MAMKTRNTKVKVSALALAVQGVLVAMYAMPAHADDERAANLKVPTSSANTPASTRRGSIFSATSTSAAATPTATATVRAVGR
jgi:hypothetical protein